MKVKVGEVYKCGKEHVKILSKFVAEGYDSARDYYKYSAVVGIRWEKNGEIPLSTRFAWAIFSQEGITCLTNQEMLRHDLEEIPKETKEMTVKEISDKLGYEVKVVK